MSDLVRPITSQRSVESVGMPDVRRREGSQGLVAKSEGQGADSAVVIEDEHLGNQRLLNTLRTDYPNLILNSRVTLGIQGDGDFVCAEQSILLSRLDAGI